VPAQGLVEGSVASCDNVLTVPKRTFALEGPVDASEAGSRRPFSHPIGCLHAGDR
jgi:hypothetical protein